MAHNEELLWRKDITRSMFWRFIALTLLPLSVLSPPSLFVDKKVISLLAPIALFSLIAATPSPPWSTLSSCHCRQNQTYLSFLSITVIRHWETLTREANRGKTRKELKTRTWTKELKQSQQTDAVYWLARIAFNTTIYLHKGSSTHSGLDPPHQPLNKKMPNELLQSIWGRPFSQLRLLLSRWP